MVIPPRRDGCACRLSNDPAADAIRRRTYLRMLTGTAASVALAPIETRAQQKPLYEAMVLSCIDPRIIDPVHNYLSARGLDGKYSQFTIAGAAIAAEAKAFAHWHQTFWDNLAASVDLHKIKMVIAIDHRDCGAARIAYGPASIADPSVETDTHKRVLTAFREQVLHKHPGFGVETGLMALDGSIQMFT